MVLTRDDFPFYDCSATHCAPVPAGSLTAVKADERTDSIDSFSAIAEIGVQSLQGLQYAGERS